MTDSLDPRINPFRPDLAAAHLEGRVASRRFVAGTPRQVRVAQTGLREGPDGRARQSAELLFGERFIVYEDRDGWCWGQAEEDGYVGWQPATALSERPFAPSHRVRAPRALLFPGPDLKLPPLGALPMNAAVAVTGQEGGYCRLATGGWLWSGHVARLDEFDRDYVATARLFLGAPYLWGGKTWEGLDCSGLVQLALQRAGIACPRDSDMQSRQVGRQVGRAVNPGPGPAGFEHGDLAFFPGHVVIVTGDSTAVHANAHHMMTVEEPLADMLGRFRRKLGIGVTAVRRIGI